MDFAETPPGPWPLVGRGHLSLRMQSQLFQTPSRCPLGTPPATYQCLPSVQDPMKAQASATSALGLALSFTAQPTNTQSSPGPQPSRQTPFSAEGPPGAGEQATLRWPPGAQRARPCLSQESPPPSRERPVSLDSEPMVREREGHGEGSGHLASTWRPSPRFPAGAPGRAWSPSKGQDPTPVLGGSGGRGRSPEGRRACQNPAGPGPGAPGSRPEWQRLGPEHMSSRSIRHQGRSTETRPT